MYILNICIFFLYLKYVHQYWKYCIVCIICFYLKFDNFQLFSRQCIPEFYVTCKTKYDQRTKVIIVD